MLFSEAATCSWTPYFHDAYGLFGGATCSSCQLEIGWKCSGSPSKCRSTVCGDGKKEGAEGCDDGNTMPFDGCSEDCQIEPSCSGTLGKRFDANWPEVYDSSS